MPSNQFENKDIIVFSKFDGMTTQFDRHDLPEDKAFWMENLQPIGANNQVTVPAKAASPLATLSGQTITKQYYFNFTSADYVINFTASGAGYAVANPGGTITQFAPPGTFSSSPDCTQLGTSRLLIADSEAGYCTWDTVVFVKYGGVSPNIAVTAGGGGYTSPVVAITGGSGSGATATVQQVGGVVVGITLTNAGTGYVTGDSLTFTITDGGPGAGATATGHVWPSLTPNPTTLAVFQGRVWLASTSILTWTGTGASYAGIGYDDFLTADASGSTTIDDADLVHSITALRNLNNYLFIVGDNSIKQIGNISVSGTTTNFTIVTLSSDQGTTFRDTVISYNRLVLFANKVGVFAVFGSSVEKISDDMDGIFRNIDFSQPLCSAVQDINNIHCFMLLVKYRNSFFNPVPATQPTRGLILTFMNKKWFVISQADGNSPDNSMSFIASGAVNGTMETFSTSGDDVTEILSNPSQRIEVILSTSLTSHSQPFMAKKTVRWAVAQEGGNDDPVFLEIESERISESLDYAVTSPVLQFQSNTGLDLDFGAITFISSRTFCYATGNTSGTSGIYLGFTLLAYVENYILNSMMLEFQPTAAFGNSDVSINR